MREIKFRGKRVDNGEWIVGDYTRYSDEKSIIMVDLLEEEDYWVSSATVGQFTGLKDKNEKEIYEGDVLRNIDNPLVDKLPFTVVWNEYYGAWFWLALEGEDGTDHFYQSIASDCEVIGNINERSHE